MTTYSKNSKQKKERDLRILVRKLKLLESAWYKLPKVKLDKPRFIGYKRFYVLRDDISRRKDAIMFKTLLIKLNSFVYSKTKDFSKYDVDVHPFHFKQSIKTLSTKEYESLENEYKKYFVRFKKHDDFRKSEYRYEFIYPFMFILKIKQHHITEVPLLDREMESQIDEIRKKINRENLWTKINRLLRGSHRYKDDYDLGILKILNDERKKDLEQQIKELD